MWKYNNRVIRQGRAWTDDTGVTHPTSWSRWTQEEKAAKGLVWEDDPLPFDSRYYWAHGNPKDLEQLKEQEVSKVKQMAAGELQQTDWYVIRASEGGTPVPSEVLSERQAIRDASNAKEAAIVACETLEELIAVVTPVATEV
jgi:hypothetical protein